MFLDESEAGRHCFGRTHSLFQNLLMETHSSFSTHPAHDRGLVPQEIEVRWKLPGGRLIWWVALVKNLQPAKSEEIANATALLEYEAGHGFPPSSYRVRFRNNRILEHKLIRRNNNVSEWRARRRPERTSEGNVLKVQKLRTNKVEKLEENIKTLRRGIVRNSRQLQLFRRSLELRRNEFGTHELDYVDRREREVLAFITQRMAFELQKSPRNPVRTHQGRSQSPSTQCTPTWQGITRMSVRISADCEQRIFETIAQKIQETSPTLQAEPFFQPSFELTQLPSEGCKQFSVVFGSFADLCKCIGINSMSDRLLMTCRYGVCKGEGIMRVLGTMEQDLEGDNRGLEFFAANSCGYKYGLGDSVDALQRDVSVIVRDSDSWNTTDRRYEKRLRVETHEISRKVRQPCLDEKTRCAECFELRWRRGNGISTRTWSREIGQSDIILGKLEVVLPCMIVSGSVLCDEYTTCMTEAFLRQVLK